MSDNKFFVWRSSDSAYICRWIDETTAECVSQLYGSPDGRKLPFPFNLKRGDGQWQSYVVGDDAS